MKTVMNHIWKICSVIFMVMLFAISGCKDDPTSPEEKKDDTPITNVTIGPGGGTVGTDDVSITIPAGAFSVDHEIAITEVADDGAFGENSVSKPYKIKGLPNDYTKPIKIKMKYTGELDGTSYIAVGRMCPNILTFDSSIVYGLQDVQDSSGYLIGELSATSNSYLGKRVSVSDKKYDKLIEAITKYTYDYTQHFGIRYPKFLEPAMSGVKQVVEESYAVVKNEMGISNLPNSIRRQIFIGVQEKIVSNDIDYHHDNISMINLSAKTVTEHKFSEIKGRFGVALFADEFEIEDNYNWLDIAVLTWLEKYLNGELELEELISTHVIEPFYGIENKDKSMTNIQYHGIGMSSVIKYLVDSPHFEKAGIGKMYKYISDNNVKPTKALLETMNALPRDWLPDFFKEYVSGNIYSQPIDKFLSNVNYSWDINSVEDTLKEFKSSNFLIRKYQDLSAKMFKINLNYEPLDNTSRMLFSMSWAGADLDGLSMVMFGIKAGEAEYLGTANAQDFEIPNLKSYYKDGMKQFLVVLVNSNITSDDYLGESDIDLKVQVTKPKLDYTKCVIVMQLNQTYYYSRTSETSTSTALFPSKWALGSFDGYTFTGSYDEDGSKGTVIVTLNEEKDKVINFSWSDNTDLGNVTVESGFSGVNVPIRPNYDNEFRINGSTSCGSISDIYYQSTTSDGNTVKLTDYSCDNLSYISIGFAKE